MSGVNKVIVVGNLGSDPELKYTPGGAAVCEFSIATSESWNDKQGQKQEKTEWHRIKVWGKRAETVAKYLSKGRQAYVEGRLETRSWDKDGIKHYRTEIIANDVQFLGGKGGGERNDSRRDDPPAPPPYEPSGGGVDDDIPFASCELAFEPNPIAKVLR